MNCMNLAFSLPPPAVSAAEDGSIHGDNVFAPLCLTFESKRCASPKRNRDASSWLGAHGMFWRPRVRTDCACFPRQSEIASSSESSALISHRRRGPGDAPLTLSRERRSLINTPALLCPPGSADCSVHAKPELSIKQLREKAVVD
jgi:hypothetical protein